VTADPRRWCEEHRRHECTALRRYRPVFCHGLAMTGTAKCLAHTVREPSDTLESLARQQVQAAIAEGTLIPLTACELCGAQPGGRVPRAIIAHHEDYTRPLDVIWLCGSCHARAHGNHGGLRAYQAWLQAQLAGTERALARVFTPVQAAGDGAA
jgi:hypothetical protein